MYKHIHNHKIRYNVENESNIEGFKEEILISIVLFKVE